MWQLSWNSVLDSVPIRDNRNKLRKILNPILEELATVLLLKLRPYHFKSNLENVTDVHLMWYQEVELRNGEQTSVEKVYGVHFQKQWVILNASYITGNYRQHLIFSVQFVVLWEANPWPTFSWTP